VISIDEGYNAVRVGPRLVAKETKFTQLLAQLDFHRTFCRTQAEAEELACLFNRRLQGGADSQVMTSAYHTGPSGPISTLSPIQGRLLSNGKRVDCLNWPFRFSYIHNIEHTPFALRYMNSDSFSSMRGFHLGYATWEKHSPG